MTAADVLVLCPDCRTEGAVVNHSSHEGILR